MRESTFIIPPFGVCQAWKSQANLVTVKRHVGLRSAPSPSKLALPESGSFSQLEPQGKVHRCGSGKGLDVARARSFVITLVAQMHFSEIMCGTAQSTSRVLLLKAPHSAK